MPNQAASVSIVADSVVVAQATADYSGAATDVVGSSSVTASASAAYVAAVHAAGVAAFSVWTLLVASGTVTGEGSLSGTPVRELLAAGLIEGTGTVTGGVRQTLIVGGQIVGAGTIQDDLTIPAAGIVTGMGSLSGAPGLIFTAQPLPMIGSGGMFDTLPLPMIGMGQLEAFFEVIQIPRPYCPPRCDKTFRYGYTLTRGDLELRVCDTSGNPYALTVVLYAFYQVVDGGQRVLVGPPNRRPAVDSSSGKVGRYYATGTAGELGQPGAWVIVWRFQQFWSSPTGFFEESFIVEDEVTSGDPGAFVGRCRKYGWL